MVDLSRLPLPQNIGHSNPDQKHISVMFNLIEPDEVMRLSPDAFTPLWLTKKIY